MAQYLLLIMYDPSIPSDGSPSRQAQHAALQQRIADSGHDRGGAGLLAQEQWSRRVRHSTNGVVTSDGPFAETKEALGGFFVVECTEEEALAYAAEIPVDNRSWVEVRRGMVFPGK